MNVKSLLTISIVLNLLLCVVFTLTCAALVQERSQDIVRVTVSSDELLPTVGKLQLATKRVANAIPLDGEEDDPRTHWRITINKQSPVIG